MNEEQFFAWLDGELPDEEAAIVARAVAADPALTAKAEAHRSMQTQLAAAFAPITDVPVSFRGATVLDLATRREERRGLPSVRQWGMLAATLLVGIVTGSMIAGGSDDAPLTNRHGTLVASTNLSKALDVQLASAPAVSGPRIGLTFRDRDGAICRSFSNDATQGVACRSGNDWRMRALVQGSPQQTGDYRMAAGMNPALAAMIESSIDGEPFDAAQEKAAMEGAWK